jgi:hypothetical protein
MNGSQDALVIEQTDGSEDKSRKVSPAQIKQYVLGNSIDDIYSVMGQMGAKNLIPYPYTNAYRTTRGVTITEGSITGSCVFNGTSTGRVDAQLGYRNSNALTLLPSVQYCLSIKTDGSFGGNLSVEAWNKGTTTYAKNIARVTPSSTDSDYKEVKFSVTQSDINNYDIAVVIYGNSGNTFNNVTVYPMLRLASDTDNTYQPYAMTNKQLTETIGDLSQTGLTGDSVAEQLATARVEITKKRSSTVSSSIIGNAVNVASATSTNPYTTPHEGFVRFEASTLCVNTYRMMKSSGSGDYKGMWLPKGASIYFTDGTPSLAQWFNCSDE